MNRKLREPELLEINLTPICKPESNQFPEKLFRFH